MNTWKYEIISRVEQDISLIRFAHSWDILINTRNKFHISARPCIILYFSYYDLLLIISLRYDNSWLLRLLIDFLQRNDTGGYTVTRLDENSTLAATDSWANNSNTQTSDVLSDRFHLIKFKFDVGTRPNWFWEVIQRSPISDLAVQITQFLILEKPGSLSTFNPWQL